MSAQTQHSLDVIVDIVTDEGCRPHGRRLQRTIVDRVIRNPIYSGRFEWPKGSGHWVQAVHESIVPWDLHQAAVDGLDRKHRRRQRKHSFTFAGMIRCGLCPEDRAIVFEIQKGRFIYGHCTGTRSSVIAGVRVRACPGAEFVPLATIEEQVAAVLERVHISEEMATFIMNEMAKDASAAQGAAETQRAVLQGQLSKLDHRMAQAYNDKLDGKIEEGFWSDQQKRMSAEKVRLQEAVRQQADESPSAFLPNVRKVLELAKDIAPLYKLGTVEQKRLIVNCVCSNLRLTGKNVEYQMKTPFAELAEGHLSSNWLRA